jgi:hypothetical protein
MVLPAGGVALNWLLLMTLWLPLLDYARSSRPLVERIAQTVPADACVAAPELSRVQVAALEVFGRYRVDATPGSTGPGGCPYLVAMVRARQPVPVPAGWTAVGLAQGPRDREDAAAIYRRQAATATP